MRKLAYVVSVLVLLMLPLSVFGIEPDETGLKTGGKLTVPVVI